MEVVLPVLGLTMSEGTIVRWLKEVGQSVRKDEPLLVVETDKAATEVLSPADGVVAAHNTPIPFAPAMEEFVIPSVDDIVAGIRRVLR
ncbi:MAG TPA: biotin/lipoyl-containing protein [Chloroflexota bacterium]|jgi:pyruvate/2-oxoglutarate/acetoin dehydrogenase E1 component